VFNRNEFLVFAKLPPIKQGRKIASETETETILAKVTWQIFW